MPLRAFAPLREICFAIMLVGAALTTTDPISAADIAVDTVLSNLRRPSGIVLRPGGTADRYELFIAESGAGRVSRWTNVAPQRKTTVVEGFRAESAASENQSAFPLSLIFLDQGLLVIGAQVESRPTRVWVFELPDGDKTLVTKDARQQLSGGPDKRQPGDELVTAFTRTRTNDSVPDILVYSVRNRRHEGWLYRSKIQAGTLDAMQSFGDDGQTSASSHFSAIATSPTGRIVAAEGTNNAGLSRLVFFNPIDGETELEMPLDLRDVSALAYNPSNGNLYAADFAGGIHRIDDISQPGHPACRAIKIADVVHPTALTFAPDGALYVTSVGNGDDNGSLFIVTGAL